MFSRLDTNFDLQLDQSEIKSLYLDRNEPCSDAFFKSCDVHVDKVLTSTEWCTCFQRYTGTMPRSANGSTLEKVQCGKFGLTSRWQSFTRCTNEDDIAQKSTSGGYEDFFRGFSDSLLSKKFHQLPCICNKRRKHVLLVALKSSRRRRGNNRGCSFEREHDRAMASNRFRKYFISGVGFVIVAKTEKISNSGGSRLH